MSEEKKPEVRSMVATITTDKALQIGKDSVNERIETFKKTQEKKNEA